MVKEAIRTSAAALATGFSVGAAVWWILEFRTRGYARLGIAQIEQALQEAAS